MPIRRPLIDELRVFFERTPIAMNDELWLRMLARQPRLVRAGFSAPATMTARTPILIAYFNH